MTYPLLEFRHSPQRIGLLRKYQGKLLLTKADKAPRAGRWAVREVSDALANIADVQRDRTIPRAQRRALSPVALLLAGAALAGT